MSIVRRLDKAVSLALKSNLQLNLVGDVIKELVENSVDAGSTEIRVSVQLDNIICIECEDNGHGIQPIELKKVGNEYSSSKGVLKFEDLEDLKTYGFMGETLHCLSQISKALRISSKVLSSSRSFTTVYNNGTRLVSLTECDDYRIGSRQGTVVKITGLFYNLPVRRTYISNTSQKSMFQQIKLALFPLCATNPELSIKVILIEPDVSREKTILSINKAVSPDDRLSTSFDLIFGNLGASMIPLRSSRLDYSVDSIFGLNPMFNGSHRFIFLNKRLVLDERLYNLITRELAQIYKSQNVYRPSFAFVLSFTGPQHPSELTQGPQKNINTVYEIQTLSYLTRCLIDKVAANFLGLLEHNKRMIDSYNNSSGKNKTRKIQPLKHNISQFFCSNLKLRKDDLSSVRLVGLMDQKFIVVTLVTKHQRTAMLALDQHACDERIKAEKLFQKYISNLSNCSVAIENIAWDLPEMVMNLFSTFESSLSTWGIKFISLNSKIVITHLPSVLTVRKLSHDLLRSGILQYLNDLEVGKKSPKPPAEKWFETLPFIPEMIINAVNSQACRSAVKFGTSLDTAQCEKIIQNLKSCELPFQCAHGRPSMVPLTML
ncbi:BA75_03802T0 [Komagataella pastoris]|uniref:BA75_03802T0 n=1 Tax=Komagataella pastoris TaxID=4922 RepID=A0A1B2JG61_PICPA|nr:BA75_03802T0 [Komagataella pastoris]